MKTRELLETKTEEIDEKDRQSFTKKLFSITKNHKTLFKKIIIIIIPLILGIIIGFVLSNKLSIFSPDDPLVDNEIINITPEVVDVTYLNTALKEASELTTAKLKINALVDFADKGIILLNKSDFVMKYTADISAGIDMSKVEINADDVDYENKKIIVSIPKATVFKPNVYHGNEYIKFYDEKFALFNVDEKEDLSEALAQAEQDAKEEAVKNGLLELADKQSESLIKGILSDATSIVAPGYTIEIKYLDEVE